MVAVLRLGSRLVGQDLEPAVLSTDGAIFTNLRRRIVSIGVL